MSIEMIRNNWKRFLAFLLIGLFGGLGVRSMWRERPASTLDSQSSSVQEAPDSGVSSQKKGLLLDLENTHCPVLGNPVDGKTYSEWNGLLVGH